MNKKQALKTAGFIGLLQVILIVLKLCNVLHCGWGWVLSPAWITAVVIAVLVVAWKVFMSWVER